MKFNAIIHILTKLKTIKPSYTYTRIDKWSELINDFKYDKFKKILYIVLYWKKILLT